MIVLKNNCPYLGIRSLEGSKVVLRERGKKAELRRNSCCPVLGMKTTVLDPKGLETVVFLTTPCSLESNFRARWFAADLSAGLSAREVAH